MKRPLAVRCDACTRGVAKPSRGAEWASRCAVCGGRGSLTYVRVAELVSAPPRIVRRIAHGRGVRPETAARICARLVALVTGPQQPALFPGRSA